MIKNTIIIRADLVCETGLHIGNQEGGNPPRGLNAPILQNPVLQIQSKTNFAPYISATSLKGKLRNIAEMLFRTDLNREFHEIVREIEYKKKVKYNLRRHECSKIDDAKKCQVCFLFGSSSGSGTESPTTSENFQARLLFRNAPLKKQEPNEVPFPSEFKMENTINRLKKMSNPRTNERTPRTSSFNFKLLYFVYESEEEFSGKHLADLASCLRFLETNYMGGNGSRGYGKIKFQNLSVDNHNYNTLEDWHCSLLQEEEK